MIENKSYHSLSAYPMPASVQSHSGQYGWKSPSDGATVSGQWANAHVELSPDPGTCGKWPIQNGWIVANYVASRSGVLVALQDKAFSGTQKRGWGLVVRFIQEAKSKGWPSSVPSLSILPWHIRARNRVNVQRSPAVSKLGPLQAP